MFYPSLPSLLRPRPASLDSTPFANIMLDAYGSAPNDDGRNAVCGDRISLEEDRFQNAACLRAEEHLWKPNMADRTRASSRPCPRSSAVIGEHYRSTPRSDFRRARRKVLSEEARPCPAHGFEGSTTISVRSHRCEHRLAASVAATTIGTFVPASTTSHPDRCWRPAVTMLGRAVPIDRDARPSFAGRARCVTISRKILGPRRRYWRDPTPAWCRPLCSSRRPRRRARSNASARTFLPCQGRLLFLDISRATLRVAALLDALAVRRRNEVFRALNSHEGLVDSGCGEAHCHPSADARDSLSAFPDGGSVDPPLHRSPVPRSPRVERRDTLSATAWNSRCRRTDAGRRALVCHNEATLTCTRRRPASGGARRRRLISSNGSCSLNAPTGIPGVMRSGA